MAGKLSITFDDALANVYSLALPECERAGVTATVFVISDLIGMKYLGQSVMSAQMLRSLSSKGWEIGSHTRTHRNLTELSDSDAEAELRESKKRLEHVTSAEVKSLSYPSGAFDERIKGIAAKYYTFARAGSAYPPLRVNSLLPRDPMELRAMNEWSHPLTIPLHLFTAHNVGRRIMHHPGMGKPLVLNPSRGWINFPNMALEARFVRKWVRKLANNQWLILTFHNLAVEKSWAAYSIRLREFREIVKTVVQSAEIVNLGEGERLFD